MSSPKILAGTCALVLASAMAFAVNWYVFVSPVQDPPEQVDAIAVYSADYGKRLARALELLHAGVSDTLVLNYGSHDVDSVLPIRKVCDEGLPDYILICEIAYLDSTQGESRLFGKIAAEKHFDSLLVVTSRTHLARAKRWMQRCFAGNVTGAWSDINAGVMTYVHEWAAMMYMMLIDRSC